LASIPSTFRLSLALGLCAAAILLCAGCQNVPKYKRSSGKFDEWGMYQGNGFKPAEGTVTAVDVAAQTITIRAGKNAKVFTVTPDTRLVHDGDDITLAQFPLNTTVEFTVLNGGKELHSVWYGEHEENVAPGGRAGR
jgi:hypothetical protein